jgi:hypothetical protein
MMCVRWIALAMVAGLFVMACGYVPVARYVADTHTTAMVHILPVENQTAYRNISVPLQKAVRHHLRAVGIGSGESDSGEAPILTIRVFDITAATEALAIHKHREVPVNQKWQIHAAVTLTDDDRQVLLGPTIVSVSEYVSAPNSIVAEITLSSKMRTLLLDRLARDIAYLILAFYSNPTPQIVEC